MGIVFRDARMQGIKKKMSSKEKRMEEERERPRRDGTDESEQEKCSKNIIFWTEKKRRVKKNKERKVEG